MKERSVYLIHIQEDVPIKTRLRYLPRLLILPYINLRKLFSEIKLWRKREWWFSRRVLALYIIDHWLLWWFYSLVATISGMAISGFYYENGRWRWLQIKKIRKINSEA